MKPSFWHGVLVGAAATAILAAALVSRRTPPAAPNPRPAPVTAARTADPPEPEPPAPQPSARPEAAARYTPPPAAKIPPPLAVRAAAAPVDESAMATSVATLRVLPTLRLKQDLPDAVVDWLGLTPVQKEEVNRLFLEDGQRIYALLHEIADRELPELKLPKEDDYRVALSFYKASEGNATLKRRWDLCCDQMVEIRKQTLTQTSALLHPAQQEKLRRLMGNFFSFDGAFTFSR